MILLSFVYELRIVINLKLLLLQWLSGTVSIVTPCLPKAFLFFMFGLLPHCTKCGWGEGMVVLLPGAKAPPLPALGL